MFGSNHPASVTNEKVPQSEGAINQAITTPKAQAPSRIDELEARIESLERAAVNDGHKLFSHVQELALHLGLDIAHWYDGAKTAITKKL